MVSSEEYRARSHEQQRMDPPQRPRAGIVGHASCNLLQLTPREARLGLEPDETRDGAAISASL